MVLLPKHCVRMTFIKNLEDSNKKKNENSVRDSSAVASSKSIHSNEGRPRVGSFVR